MAFKVTVKANINIPKHMAKVQSNGFWEYAATEWWKLITPYTPMESGNMSESVTVRPKEIEYNAPQAHYLYKGELMVDPETGSSWAKKDAKKVYAGKELSMSKDRHPLASKEWDKAAEPTQKPKLVDAMQDYVDSGRLKLNE